MTPSNALLIFIKNPEKGKVKTRLAQTVGDDMALKIYLALLEHTQKIALAIDANRLLFYSQFIDEEDQWSNADFQKKMQASGDLGNRMMMAFRQALAQHQKVVIIGSDCASLTVEIVEKAFELLEAVDYVVGPAKDGGYYLLGMKENSPALFEDMIWSTDQVFPTTIKRIKASNKKYALLPELSDIDYEEDWKTYGWELD